MRKKKLVMVGNGMAGVRTLEELLKIAPEQYEITVFGRMLQKSLEERGLKFLLGKQTEMLIAGESGRVAAIRLKDGSQIPADLVDATGGVYKKLVIRDNRLVGGVLYGDIADGPWYFQLLRDGQDIHEIRDHLLFGQSHVGDVGHQGHSKAAAMADSAEVCGGNGGIKSEVAQFFAKVKSDEVFALRDQCPHKGGPLSQGLVHGNQVTCPLHGWKLRLDSGEAVAPDQGCSRRYPVRVESGTVFLEI